MYYNFFNNSTGKKKKYIYTKYLPSNCLNVINIWFDKTSCGHIFKQHSLGLKAEVAEKY